MTAYLDYHDGTTDIKDFEKNCALPSFQGRELAEMCRQKEKDGIKAMIASEKAKKKKLKEKEKVEELTYKDVEIDDKRDVKNPDAYKTFANNFVASNPLNGYEYYQDLFKNFCNEVDHDTSKNIRPEDLDLKLPENHVR